MFIVAVAVLLMVWPFLGARCARSLESSRYTGTVIEKRIVTFQAKSGSHVAYKILIRNPDGSVVMADVPKELYDSARVGMRAEKRANETYPRLSR